MQVWLTEMIIQNINISQTSNKMKKRGKKQHMQNQNRTQPEDNYF